MKLKEQIISPTIALDLLSRNNSNRKISDIIVNAYAADILAGKWEEETAEPIKISKEGRLLDGQHRLSAVVKACKSVKFLVASDLKDEIFSVLDTGKKRNGGDMLTILGTKNANMIAAGIASWFAISSGRMIKTTGGNTEKRDKGLTNKVLLDEYQKRSEFWDTLAHRVNTNYNTFGKVLTTSYLMGWTARLIEIDEAKAHEFMDKLCSGLNMTSSNDPIFQLRAIFISSKANAIRKLDNKYRNAIFIKAWNLFYTKSEVRTLHFTMNSENYPMLETKPLFVAAVHEAKDDRVVKPENV